MKTTVEKLLIEIREAYLEERRAAGSSDAGDAVVVPLRERGPTWSVEKTRWDIDQLPVVWPSFSPKR
jgi:hypothetical protein